MKRKLNKILGIGLALVLALALVGGFVLPAAASPGETINEWYKFAYPDAGADGDWFRDASITAIGPMAEAINGDLYAAVAIGPQVTLEDDETGIAEWRTDEAYSGSSFVYLSVPSASEYAELYFPVSIKLGDIDLTKTSYWCKSISGTTIPYLMFELETGVRINDDAPSSAGFTAAWAQYVVSTGPDAWQNDADFTGTAGPSGWATWDETVGHFGADTLVTGVLIENSGVGAVSAYVDYVTIDGATYDLEDDRALRSRLMKSTDGGRTWAATGYEDVDGSGPVVDMVCSSIDEDILYVTDGNYVYKSTDAGDEFAFVAKDSLEEALEGACGTAVTDFPITCIDVGYDDDDNPIVFIGTKGVGHGGTVGSVYFVEEAEYPRQWEDLELACEWPGYDAFSVGCAPDFADSGKAYAVISDGSHTRVVSTTGTRCDWPEFAELFWNCDDAHPFGTQLASRIAFPDDWEDSETLFVGVVDADTDITDCDPVGDGGDVYMVWQDGAHDMNVAGIHPVQGGCVGAAPVDIISLDIFGDTDEASLIAGAFCNANVYCSEDGGWSWDVSTKNPTGDSDTYVLWYEDTALAATAGDECAVSLCCGEDYPCEFWNQISLIATDIDAVLSGDHSPGYITESETLFMLSDYTIGGTQSLFRYDQTNWERVYCSTIAGADIGPHTPSLDLMSVHVSPDFNTTNCVYLANDGFQMWRTLDAGCSWDKLTFPCVTRPQISAGVVIDEDTVITGGEAMVYKTTRHGARPWDEYDVATTGNVMSFDLEPGYEDPGTILLGDDLSQVFISEDGGETWDLVGDCATVLGTGNTSVVFDPTSDIIYAAAGDVIARCVIDPDEDWADQVWDEIYSSSGDEYWGIVAAGDTALYVTDSAKVDGDDGGVLRSLNPDAEDAADVVFERLTGGLTLATTQLSGLLLTTDVSDEGCAENVLWSLDSAVPTNVWNYEDTLAAPVTLGMPVDEQKLATTTEATLNWKELCDADTYEVSLYRYCPECPDLKDDERTYLTDDTCITVGDGKAPFVEGWGNTDPPLEVASTYYWKVRVAEGSPTLSKWSEERTFSTALLAIPFLKLCSPACGGQDIILTPNFSWDPVEGATGYDIELATTETFTAGVVRGSSSVNAWVAPEPLEYATTYYWRVRAEKDGVYSAWTVCMFTTMEEPVEPPPPVTVEKVPPPEVTVEVPPAEMITPNWIYAIVGIGAALVIVVIVLIVRTRRPS